MRMLVVPLLRRLIAVHCGGGVGCQNRWGEEEEAEGESDAVWSRGEGKTMHEVRKGRNLQGRRFLPQ
jgi:hypothetical protein